MPEKLDLLRLRAMTYDPVDWIAVIRTAENTVGNYPVFVNQADQREYIVRYGRWELAESSLGFERFQEVKPAPTKQLYDPLRRNMLDTGIPKNQFEEVKREWADLVR